LSLLLAGSEHALAQHLGSRQQWQPQVTVGGFDPDRRLEQTVKLDILGRSAVSALAIISQASNLSLYVAPEDLNTVGERKLSIFAFDGCRLKDLMVQIPEALQECHWDIDESREKPVYLLHRNAGGDHMVAQLAKDAETKISEEKRAKRVARLEATRRALTMLPAELTELEESDLLLARAMRDPETRATLQAFVSLPADAMRRFLDTGNIVVDYWSAPELFETTVTARVQLRAHRRPRGGGSAPLLRCLQENLLRTELSLRDQGMDFGFGVMFEMSPCNGLGGHLLPPRFVPAVGDVLVRPWPEYQELLLRSGTPDDKAADSLLLGWIRKGGDEKDQERERQRAARWLEPEDSELRVTVALDFDAPTGMAEIERAIARETGLSVVSDYFTVRPLEVPYGTRAPLALWRLLYLVGEQRHYTWRKAGNCLTLDSDHWFDLAQGEILEALILACRKKLDRQGRLTLDDLAAFAVALGGRELREDAFPQGLAYAGLRNGYRGSSWGLREYMPNPSALLFYASLSSDQRAKARSQAGLRFTDMAAAQREQLQRAVVSLGPPISAHEVAEATFRLTSSTEGTGPGGFERFVFSLDFPHHQSIRAEVILRAPLG
jgi:hypothetical protein